MFFKSSKFHYLTIFLFTYQTSKLSIIKQLTNENFGFIEINP